MRCAFDPFESFYREAGEKIAGHLVCRRRGCEHRQACNAEQAAAYLREGWPKHCGQTMELVRKGRPQ